MIDLLQTLTPLALVNNAVTIQDIVMSAVEALATTNVAYLQFFFLEIVGKVVGAG